MKESFWDIYYTYGWLVCSVYLTSPVQTQICERWVKILHFIATSICSTDSYSLSPPFAMFPWLKSQALIVLHYLV